jgi:sulfur-carrier protein
MARNLAGWRIGVAMIKCRMAKVHFTSNLRRHVDCPSVDCAGETVRVVLDHVFTVNPRLETYVLDDQRALRKHMRILVDGKAVMDITELSDPVAATSEMWVMQALSGG